MKIIKIIFTFIFTIFIGMGMVNASASLSVNRSTIETGQSVTATVRVTGAAWAIHINGTGNVSGCSQSFVHSGLETGAQNITRNLTLTCRSTGVGSINFVLSGNVTAAGSDRASSVSGTRSVTVTPVIPRSPNNNLTGISVEGFEISPEFSKDVTEYTVTVLPTTETVNISAKTEHNAARVAGTGTQEVVEGDNIFELVVTAENGSKQTYILNVIVPEKDPIEAKVGNLTLFIMRKLPESLPLGFETTTVTIDEEEVVAITSEKLGITLILLRDDDNNTFYYIFEDGKIGDLFFIIETKEMTIFLTSTDTEIKGMKRVMVIINGAEVEVFRLTDKSKTVIIYGTDLNTNKSAFYRYDIENNTLQLFDRAEHNYLMGMNQDYLYVIYALGGALALSMLIIMLKGRKPKTPKVKPEKPTKDNKKEEVKKEESKPKEEVKEEKKEETPQDDFWEDDKKKKKKKK